MSHKIHWIHEGHSHGLYVNGYDNGTTLKERITCRHCRFKAGLEPSFYRGRKRGPHVAPLGACARQQVLAMVLGLG